MSIAAPAAVVHGQELTSILDDCYQPNQRIPLIFYEFSDFHDFYVLNIIDFVLVGFVLKSWCEFPANHETP